MATKIAEKKEKEREKKKACIFYNPSYCWLKGAIICKFEKDGLCTNYIPKKPGELESSLSNYKIN